MIRILRLSFPAIFFFASTVAPAQAPKSGAPAGSGGHERGIALAMSGHCTEALPLLKRSIRQVTDKELKKKVGLIGLQCAMTHNVPYESLSFLEVLGHDFPGDPEVLYVATHAYSDLSLHTSKELMREAPFSYQVHELNAEALEIQGKWDEAVAEYKKILEISPLLPGMHARIGRALLSKAQPSSEAIDEAKKNFETELEIDPRNAGAEYVLGELAKDANDLTGAIHHYSQATKLDAGFAEAYLGLGASLVASKRFTDAIPPLVQYEKLAPDSPSGHFQLAMAYAGAGRKEDANREAALQRQAAASLEQVKRHVAEGLLQQQSDAQGTQTPAPPK